MPAAAKQGDTVQATDTHIVLVPAAAGAPVPTPTPLPFNGPLSGGLSTNVFVEKAAAATQGSTATNTPAHLVPPPNSFQRPPSNTGTVAPPAGPVKVFINGKPAARHGDAVITCNDPVDAAVGRIVSTTTTVFFA